MIERLWAWAAPHGQHQHRPSAGRCRRGLFSPADWLLRNPPPSDQQAPARHERPCPASLIYPRPPQRCSAAPARARFAAHYPETPHILGHNLTSHPLLEIEALARLAERAAPSPRSEYNRGDLPIGGWTASRVPTGLTIAETIRRVAEAESWAVPQEYRTIFGAGLRGAVAGPARGNPPPRSKAATGAMLTPQRLHFRLQPQFGHALPLRSGA